MDLLIIIHLYLYDKHSYAISNLSVTCLSLKQEVILDFDSLLIEHLEYTLLRYEIIN